VNATKRFVALSAAGVLLLAGCGGNSTKASSPKTQQPGSAVAGLSDASTAPSGSATVTSNAANIDVCSLLSQDDAAATARAHSLNGAQTAATVYTLTATPQTDTGSEPSSSCAFSIDGQGASGTVVIQVQSAKDFAIYASGTKIPDLGDEAYRGQGSTVVRVGDLMLSAGEDSFTDAFVVDLYRKMIPHLK
jgi:hypothetical protein